MVCESCGFSNAEGMVCCAKCGAPLALAGRPPALERESAKADARAELCGFLLRFRDHVQKAMPDYEEMEKNTRIANRFGAQNYDLQKVSNKKAKKKGLIWTVGGAIWAVLFVSAIFYALAQGGETSSSSGHYDTESLIFGWLCSIVFVFGPLLYGVFRLLVRKWARKKIKHNKDMVKEYEALAQKSANKVIENYMLFAENRSANGNPIIPFQCANPAMLEAIYDVIRAGRADTIKEAAWQIRNDEARRKMMRKVDDAFDSLSQQLGGLRDDIYYRWW